MVSLQIPGIVLGEQISRVESKKVFTARSGGHRLAVNVWEGPEAEFDGVIAAVATAATVRVAGLGRILTIGATEEAVYWIREYVEGQTLSLRLGDGVYSKDELLRLATRLAKVLEAMDSRGLVHRALHSGNIIIDTQGYAWVLDVGVCTPGRSDDAPEVDAPVGDIYPFLAPELHDGSLVDGRADLYALGAVLYHAATGRLPVPATADAPLVPLGELNPETAGGFSQIVSVLLDHDPAQRYQSADALLRDLGRLDELDAVLRDVGELRDSSTGAGALRTRVEAPLNRTQVGFVGRDLELTRCACAWQSATQGQGALVIVEGEEGLGKTRLVEEFLAREVDPEAALVLRATGDPADFTPYASIAGALRRFIEQQRLRPVGLQPRIRFRLRKALGERLDVFSDLVPLSAAFLGFHVAAAPSEDLTLKGQSYHERVASCLRRLAQAFPSALFVFDGVHRMEESTRRVIGSLAATLKGSRTLMVLTRSSEAGADKDATHLLAGDARVERLLLAPLGLDAVEEIASHILGGEMVDPRFVAQLQRTTRGNPRAIRGYVAMALRRGALWPEGSVWYARKRALRRLVDPRDQRGMLRADLDRLDGASLRTLGAAALLARPFRTEEVLAMTDGTPPQFRCAVDEAVALGLLVRLAVDTWIFTFYGVSAALVSRLDAATRAVFHGRAAAWLESTPEAQSFAYARHVALSDMPVQDTGRYRAVNHAGREAVRCGDDAAAFVFLEESRRVSVARGVQLTGDVHKSLATLSERAGQYEAAIVHLTNAADNATTTIERAKLLGQIATNALLGRGDPSLALATVSRALGLVGFSMPDVEMAALERAIPGFSGWDGLVPESLTHTLADPRGVAFANEGLETAIVATYLSGGGRAVFGRIVRSLRKVSNAGDPRQETRACLLLSFSHAVLGQPRRAVRELQRAKQGVLSVGLRKRYDALKLFLRFRFETHVEIDTSLFDHRPTSPLGLLLTLEMAHALWLRGHSSSAGMLLAQVERLPNTIGGEAGRPALWHAAELLHGEAVRTPDAFTEDELRAANDAPPSDYLRASSRSAAVFMELERGESASRLDLFCQQREAMGVTLGSHCLQLSDYRVYLGYVRLAQAMSQHVRGNRVELAGLREAIAGLAAPRPKSVFLPHRLVLEAGLKRLSGQPAQARKLLQQVEDCARKWDNRWARYEAARLRACLLIDEGRPDAAETEAFWAHQLAERFGWRTRSARIRKEFDLRGAAQGPRVEGVEDPTTQRYRQQLDALLEVGLASSMLLEPGEQARVALDEIVRVFDAERACLFIYDEEVGSLSLDSCRDRDGNTLKQVAGYQGRVVQQVWDSLEPVVIRPEGDGMGVMAAPLIARDRLLGVVYLDGGRNQSKHHAEDVQILLAIANHLAVTIETSRVNRLEVEFASERRERRLAETLRSVANTLSTTLELSEVLARLLESLNQLIEYDRAMVLMRQGEIFEVAAARSSDGEILAGLKFDRGSYAVLDEILEARRPLTFDELPADKRAEYPLGGKPSKSWMAVPLLRGTEVTGLLILADERRGAYSAYDSEIAFTFAGQAAIALENARLFGEVERLAVIDELTAVYNRRAFFDLAQREFQRTMRYQTELSVIMIDLDNFKEINDTHGHSTGDEVLRTLAQRFQSGVRELDVLGRYGGEEFVILAPQTGIAEACAVADRLRRLVSATPVVGPAGELKVSASFGVAAVVSGDQALSVVLDKADKALYRAKAEGKDCVRRFRL